MIPDILWQSWKTKDVPKSVKTQADSWNISNPQLQKRFMDDIECASFILEHFGESVHELYLQLPQPIMRADFWRVAVVYVHGGYYSDLDITCNVKIKDLIPGKPEAVFIKEGDNVSNFFFGATPKHPVLKTALDRMIVEAKTITEKDTQSFGMHNLHSAVKDYYKITDVNSDVVYFINNHIVYQSGQFIHKCSSFTSSSDYDSWRISVDIMKNERELSNDILFFTTFNKNGYDLYGRDWIKSFITTANYYNKFKAKIYYEGFEPTTEHPSITWVRYEDAIPNHDQWKDDYLSRSTHSDYVKKMAIRFSHKAFVIQHVLQNSSNDYLIWLDGDCIFKEALYSKFPKALLGDKFLACQVEENKDLNHIESGVLIFNGKHQDTQLFAKEFSKWYLVENVLSMSQPYDGFIIFKSLLTCGLKYVNLNEGYGKGGIQSDPNMTFCNPDIKDKFIHNIGWTGKSRYSEWDNILKRDEIYKTMKTMLFGGFTKIEINKKKEKSMHLLQKLKSLKHGT
jgi:mannosyltransferase OCH1-like enzyme